MGLSVGALAQQEGVLMMYGEHMGLINPAYVGSTGGASLIGSVRSQWVGIDDAPELQALSLVVPVGRKVGLGLSVVSDQVFVEDRTSMNVDFSYRVRLSGTMDLYLGLKGGGGTYRLNPYLLGSAGAIGDASLSTDREFDPNVGVGAYLVRGRSYLSLSSPRILRTDRVGTENGSVTQVTGRVHTFLGAGHIFPLGRSSLRASAMLRHVSDAPLTVDLLGSLRVLDGGLELGAALNTNRTLGGFFSARFRERFNIGYAYSNIISSEFSGVTGGTHEFFVRFVLSRGDAGAGGALTGNANGTIMDIGNHH